MTKARLEVVQRVRLWPKPLRMVAGGLGLALLALSLAVRGGGNSPRATANRFLGDFYDGRLAQAAALTQRGDLTAMKRAYTFGEMVMVGPRMRDVRWTVESCRLEGSRRDVCPVSFANNPWLSPLALTVIATKAGGYRVDETRFVRWADEQLPSL